MRDQNWRSPAEEQLSFRLPPGFEVNLFVAEPEINKPLNMAWDHKGRLWITNTVEYPYPAKDGAVARDSIKILQDTNGDGKADLVKTFAEGLNIPMGLLPVEDGVICFSIPNLWYLKDTDGDDRVDERIKLLGPFDTTRDTHGMINALRLGADGWVYACHGFNNQSKVTASDGSSVFLQSGNTFRFRPDGSSIQQFTQGQVNPFGLTRDEYGNWYSADCHSKPITALLPGGCYSSFGRPDDGLGFAPEMMSHLHGSTAICGIHYLQCNSFPKAYQGLFYSGNVMTSRINCNRLVWQGSTASAEELPDFMTSDDSWFRPVDIQLGPDGALYVADFYNKIIGHYEVDLEHPGRDRTSGRIWRICYTADALNKVPAQTSVDNAELADLLDACIENNETLIQAQLKHLSYIGKSLELSSALLNTAFDRQANSRFRMACWETLAFRGEITAEVASRMNGSLMAEPNAWDLQLLVPLVRLAAKLPKDVGKELLPVVRELLPEALDSNAISNLQLARAALEFLATIGTAADVEMLLATTEQFRDVDPAISHMAKIAARDILQQDSELEVFHSSVVESHGHLPLQVYSIALGINTEALARIQLEEYSGLRAELKDLTRSACIELAVRYPSLVSEMPEEFVAAVRDLLTHDRIGASEALQKASKSLKNEGLVIPPLLKEFAHKIAKQFVGQIDGGISQWADQQGRDWPKQKRQISDGANLGFHSSHALGESYRGTLVSNAFQLTPDFSFYLVGHNGPIDQPGRTRNYVRVVDSDSGIEIARRYPPRSDVGVKVTFPKLGDYWGRSVRLEVVDADEAGSYAWLAVGGFTIEQLNEFDSAQDELKALENLIEGKLVEWESEVSRQLVEGLGVHSKQRVRLLQRFAEQKGLNSLVATTKMALRLRRPDLIGNESIRADNVLIQKLAKEIANNCNAVDRLEFVRLLLQSSSGAKVLVYLLEQGVIGEAALASAVIPELGIGVAERKKLQAFQAASAGVESSAEMLLVKMSNMNFAAANSEQGKQLFTEQCANCHQLGGFGKTIGPQLDGAISRSVPRLLEDILLPNLNVDAAFRQSTVLLENDSIVAGLVQDRSAEQIAVIGTDGKEKLFFKTEVAEIRSTKQSLMPSNFGELLKDEQLAALLFYLKNQVKKE